MRRESPTYVTSWIAVNAFSVVPGTYLPTVNVYKAEWSNKHFTNLNSPTQDIRISSLFTCLVLEACQFLVIISLIFVRFVNWDEVTVCKVVQLIGLCHF